jgi:diketogulonate reductase-like aldo/keto reductase
MSANGIKIAFGGGLWLNVSVEEVTGWLDVINEVDIKIIDTAQVYGASEELIGKTGAPSNFTIDTKLPGAWSDKPSTKDGVIELGKACLKRLNTESVSETCFHSGPRLANRIRSIFCTCTVQIAGSTSKTHWKGSTNYISKALSSVLVCPTTHPTRSRRPSVSPRRMASSFRLSTRATVSLSSPRPRQQL